ncbi:D-beta-hydroxybutyrate dehydrogenase, mitochondrial-like isoform X2 [Ruditapes philippinarum]|uniref:D-beta-hydroxybutyrate dehydrogenase, mitochondrial-like isoform X2 n=1 Tax=Ruditapes philippinarum TaxID=129788 RepID=UPI00295B8C0C|nr:D-beta-hydroxybutyrate dehydrogenase, mitochondrial-like isoform X2 [Ruditapes philippinarum]
METGSSNDIKLQIEKLGKAIYMEIGNFSVSLSTILLTVYIMLILTLITKLTRNSYVWTVASTLQLLLIIFTTVTSLIWSFNILGYSTSMIMIFHLLRCLPKEQVHVENKAILVTGCDRGIGYELVKRLDTIGYQVFAGCLFKGQKGEQELVAACSTRLTTLQMDVRNREQVKQAATSVQNHLGCNSLAPVPHMGMYCASKAALATFSECLRYEMKQWDVQVSTIIPSGYKTGILAYDKMAVAERWWSCAPPTVKDDFGKECFTPVFKFNNHESTTSADLSSIVNTIVKAVSEKNAQPFYYSGFMAKTLPFVYLHLPSILQEPAMNILAQWFKFLPKALREEKTVKDKEN